MGKVRDHHTECVKGKVRAMYGKSKGTVRAK
jgi:hypothetical protein